MSFKSISFPQINSFQVSLLKIRSFQVAFDKLASKSLVPSKSAPLNITSSSRSGYCRKAYTYIELLPTKEAEK